MKLIKTGNSYELMKQGFLQCSTNHSLVDQLNIEEGNIRYKLSKQNCKELFGEITAEEFIPKNDNGMYSRNEIVTWAEKYKTLELTADKKYSEEDMIDAVMLGVDFESNGIVGIKNYNELKELAIKRASKPTELEVEFVMQCLDPTCDGKNRKGECITGDKPKLDSEGCVILKRKV